MKNIRIILSLVALCISIGGAVASVILHQTPVYEFVDLPGIEDDRCLQVSMDCDNGAFPCRINGTSPQLRATNNVATQCGVELYIHP